ncbi:MAG: hypothetical protein IJT54_04200 [Candidatus Methanomethylophilaceae archaeon]|nr:hypothetical protein [Candidatus Methanomethylophilaceae archaeon]
MSLQLYPCDMKNGSIVCSYDPRIVLDCKCPSCIASRVLFLNPRDVFGEKVGIEFVNEYDSIRRSME